MLETFLEGLGAFVQPFYIFGVVLWNSMLGLIGLTAVQTPSSFSGATWQYIINDLQPWTFAVGATMLNISFYIGFIRQAGNLKQDFTLEVFVECCIKVAVGNALLLSGTKLMKLFFSIASELAGGILLETPVVFAQADTDVGSVLFYMLFGFVFFVVCLVCSVMIFFAVYGRFLQLYLLVAVAPVAVGTLPGGPGLSQTAYAWLRTFLAKVFEIVVIVMAITIAAKMCNSIDFGTMESISGIFDGAVQAVQNICTMVLLTATVKGTDSFMRRVFAL